MPNPFLLEGAATLRLLPYPIRFVMAKDHRHRQSLSAPQTLIIQDQLLLGYKNGHSYGTRTVIFTVQEQLFLWYKNNCFYGTRITVLTVQE